MGKQKIKKKDKNMRIGEGRNEEEEEANERTGGINLVDYVERGSAVVGSVSLAEGAVVIL